MKASRKISPPICCTCSRTALPPLEVLCAHPMGKPVQRLLQGISSEVAPRDLARHNEFWRHVPIMDHAEPSNDPFSGAGSNHLAW